jgi:hypothetical protein
MFRIFYRLTGRRIMDLPNERQAWASLRALRKAGHDVDLRRVF